MADQNNPVAAAAPTASAETQQPSFGIQRIYLKGASVELPGGAKSFTIQGNAHVNLNVEVSNEQLAENIFEVSLRATVESTIDGKVVHLIEVDQAGIFEMKNVPNAELPVLLAVAAPRLLLPYLRASISDMGVRASVAPFYMPDLDWETMYQNNVAQQNAGANLLAATNSGAVH